MTILMQGKVDDLYFIVTQNGNYEINANSSEQYLFYSFLSLSHKNIIEKSECSWSIYSNFEPPLACEFGWEKNVVNFIEGNKSLGIASIRCRKYEAEDEYEKLGLLHIDIYLPNEMLDRVFKLFENSRFNAVSYSISVGFDGLSVCRSSEDPRPTAEEFFMSGEVLSSGRTSLSNQVSFSFKKNE